MFVQKNQFKIMEILKGNIEKSEYQLRADINLSQLFFTSHVFFGQKVNEEQRNKVNIQDEYKKLFHYINQALEDEYHDFIYLLQNHDIIAFPMLLAAIDKDGDIDFKNINLKESLKNFPRIFNINKNLEIIKKQIELSENKDNLDYFKNEYKREIKLRNEIFVKEIKAEKLIDEFSSSVHYLDIYFGISELFVAIREFILENVSENDLKIIDIKYAI